MDALQLIFVYCGKNPLTRVDPTGLLMRGPTQSEESLKGLQDDISASTIQSDVFRHTRFSYTITGIMKMGDYNRSVVRNMHGSEDFLKYAIL